MHRIRLPVFTSTFRCKGLLASPFVGNSSAVSSGKRQTTRSLTRSGMDIVGPLNTAGIGKNHYWGKSCFFLWLKSVKLKPSFQLVSWVDFASRGVKQWCHLHSHPCTNRTEVTYVTAQSGTSPLLEKQDVLGSPGTLNMVSSWDVSFLLFALLCFFHLKESNSVCEEQALERWFA